MMHPFRTAVSSGNQAAVEDLLADDVLFTSPVAFTPYPGKRITAAILRAVTRVFEDFHYIREIGDEGSNDYALLFQAHIGSRAITGCDFLHTNDEGLIDDFMVMVRPLSAAKALSEAMAVEFETVKREAGL